MIIQRRLISPGKKELQATFANKFKELEANDERQEFKKATLLAIRDFLFCFIMFLISCAAVCAPQIIEYIINFK